MQSSRGVVWGGASERQRGSGSMGPPGGVDAMQGRSWPGSGLPRAAVRCACWWLAVQIAANAVRGPQRGAIQVGHGLQAVSRRTGRALRARGQLCPWLSAGSARRHRTLEKAGQVYNKKTHGRRPWQAGRSTQTQRYAGRRRHGTRATPQRRGHGLCRRHRCNEAARRESHPHHHGQNGQSCPNGHTGTTGAGRDGAGACTRQPTARERASGGLAGSSRHGLLGFTATTGTFHAGAPEMKVRDYCAATWLGQRVFCASRAVVSPRTGDAAAGYGSWPWPPLRCGFPRPAW